MNDFHSAQDIRSTPAADVARFCIVTPVFNCADYIDETLASVMTQAGAFEIFYHVQDGGSTDDTMEKVRRWSQLLESGQLPVLCRGIHFTYVSEPDKGMYDAINRAFASALPPGPDVVMGWVNADDRIAPGSFSTITNIRRQYPDIRFLGGRVSLLDQTGSIIGINLTRTYSQPCMAAGLYDGRALPFVMQEGTFWCADLWHAVGGALDTSFRLAGDWDLWRRLARHAPYVAVDSVLGFHRRRPGQLSGQMDNYYRELDSLLKLETVPTAPPATIEADALPAFAPKSAVPVAGELRSGYDRILREFEQLQSDPAKFRTSAYVALVVRFNLDMKRWEKQDNFGLVLGTPDVAGIRGVQRSISVVPTAGFSIPEGPYPECSLPAGIRWMSNSIAEGEVFLPQSGRYEVVLRCRSWTNGQSVVLIGNGVVLGRLAITPHGNDRETELRLSGRFGTGRLALGIEVKQPDPMQRTLLVTGWYVVPKPERSLRDITPVDATLAPIGALAGPLTSGLDWPRISVVVPTRNQGQFIADTLESVLRQGYPNLELIVADGASTDETREVLRRYARHITCLISEPDSGQSNAINKGFRAASGEILTWLNSDDLLAKGALHAVALAFRTSGADLVAGVCDVFNSTNITTHRHLPCLRDGAVLPLEFILDLENRWMRGQFFHQPEVFFTRAMWERAGGAVDEALYYSMDFDLWARMARLGARISVIGRTLAHYRMHAAQKTSTPAAYRPELLAHAGKLRVEYGMSPLPEPMPARPRLRVAMFNDYGFKYGAGIAHRRIAEALALAGQDVVALAYADFDIGPAEPKLSVEAVASAILDEKPDLVLIGNLHAIVADFDLLGALLAHDVPVVFYAHDQWLVTGRCGYPADCARYLSGCDDACPTASQFPALAPDAIAPAFARRRAVLDRARAEGRRFAVFTNSFYMRDYILDALSPAQRPPVHVVPFGIDTRVFTHGKRWEARVLLDLPSDRFIIITAAADVADQRKGMPLLLQALRSLPNPEQVLVLVLGFGSGLPDLACEIRFTGYLDREDSVALHYQAADIFVGPSLQEAFGQTYIEAGACGVPAVAFKVGGVVDAVLDGVTGLLMEQTTADALVEGIQRLRTDTVLRRQLGTQAVLFVRNRFSLEASAAGLLAALTSEQSLGLDLIPNVMLSVRQGAPIAVRYLSGPRAGRMNRGDRPDWLPLFNISGEESGLGSAGALPERFWWASGPRCRMALRVSVDGDYRIQIRCRNHLANQLIEISSNGGPSQKVALLSDSFNITQNLEVELPLVAGLNRIDIVFAVSQREAGGMRQLALLLEDVEAIPAALDLTGAPEDGSLELLDGFSFVEGPYPEHGLPSEFRWAIGERTRMRLFSGLARRRVIELRLRNIHPDQALTIRFDNKVVMNRTLVDATISNLVRLRFEASFAVGFHSIQIAASVRSTTDDGGRELAFAFEGMSFHDAGELHPRLEHDAIRWDLSDGISGEEGPHPEGGLLAPFRWITTRQPRLTIDRTAAGTVQLVLRYRAPMPGQRALLSLNDAAAGHLEFPGASFADPGEARITLPLRAGQNLLGFDFAKAITPAGDLRELVLLLEALDIAAPEAAVEPPSGPIMPSDDLADGAWEYDTGFSFEEGPYPDLGLMQPFRWGLGELSTINLHSRITGPRLLRLVLRNAAVAQRVNVTLDGATLADLPLQPGLAKPNVLEIEATLRTGWQALQIRPAQWDRSPVVARALSVIVQSVSLSEVPSTTATELLGAAPEDGTWHAGNGFRRLEGPYHNLGMPVTFRWCVGGRAEFALFSGEAGTRPLSLTMRNFHPDQQVTLQDDSGQVLASFPLRAWALHRPEVRTVMASLQAGWNSFTLICRTWTQDEDMDKRLAVILEHVAVEDAVALT